MHIQSWFSWGLTGYLLVIQGTLKSLLQHHRSEASILQCSAFFLVQFSHLYMTTGKNIVLTIWTFVGKVMSLLLNKLSRFVITFLPRRECLLISCLQSPSAVILEPKKTKIFTAFTFSPSICLKVTGPDAMILVSLLLSSKAAFSLSSFTLLKRLCLPSEWYHLHIWSCWCFSWQSWSQLVIHPAWHFAWCTLLLS